MNRKHSLIIMYLAVSLVYLSGLFITLMENDSAQHASMAMKMVLNNDFFNIYKGNAPYLDKPHLHFWLAAISMKLFGINHIAYRIPSLIFIAMAACCTFNLGKRLYKSSIAGHWAALMFLSAQTIILSGHDVRTDAILTGAVALGVCFLIAFIQTGKTLNVVLGGIGLGFALAAKGMVGVGIIALCVFSYLLQSKEWKRFFRFKSLYGLLAFLLTISPVLYAYYQQYDLHPDLWVRGEKGVSGIRFILWDQSFKRFSGEDFGEASPDYFFFFHTLLWVFIPFSLIFYGGLFSRLRRIFKQGFKNSGEFLTVGGFWLVMLVFSFSKFKLPHYLNSLIPILSLLTASYLLGLKNTLAAKVYWAFNVVLYLAGLGLIIYLGYFVFIIVNYILLVPVIVGVSYILLVSFTEKKLKYRLLLTGVLFVSTFNFFLNTQFYPPLAEYQAGVQTARFVKSHNINAKEICMPEQYTNWTLDFYTQTNIMRLPTSQFKEGSLIFIQKEKLEQLGLNYTTIYTTHQYRITKLKEEFLNPKTRQAQLTPYVLVRLGK